MTARDFRARRSMAAVVLLLGLAASFACGETTPTAETSSRPAAEDTAEDVAQATETPTAVLPTHTPAPPVTPTAATLCVWSWASRPLPELSEEVRAALDEAGIVADGVRTEAYGENCIDAETNTVRDFAAMQTDFRVTLPVDDAADQDALGDLAGAGLHVLDGFPPAETRGHNRARSASPSWRPTRALHSGSRPWRASRRVIRA